jgi:PAS domain S-box-containing protein
MSDHAERLSRRAVSRYLIALAAVVTALALRLLLAPLTGTGAPFVLFFAAVLLTSLYAGTGPGLAALVTSLPIAAYMFVLRAGYAFHEAAFQALLYAVDGLIVVYITHLTTERRRTLDHANAELLRLRNAAERFAARTHEVIELAPDAFFLANLDARFTDVNRAACQLLGYDRDELLGMTIYDIIRQEEAGRLEADRREMLVPGTTIRNEWRLKRKDGTFVPVEVSANILEDGRWQAFVRDITERRRVEDQRQVFVSLLDNSMDFIGIADPTGKPIYLNAAGRRMIGLTPDFPVEQLQIQDCYPPELRSFVSDVLLKTMVERGAWSGDTFFQNFETHERIPVSDTHFMIRDQSGARVLGMGTVTRDMSEARRNADERERLLAAEQSARGQLETAMARLGESEERFRLTFEEAPIGMALVGLDGTFARVNHRLCEITGYVAEELTNLKFQDITHADDVGTDVVLSTQLVRGEIPRYQLEKRYVRKDGSLIDVMLSRSLLRGPDNVPICYITQMEDISGRKQADRALRRSEAKFSGIISIAADAIISVDTNQRITVFNEGAERIFGYSKQEMIGAPLDRLIPERYRTKHSTSFAAFAAGDAIARTMAERMEVYGLRKSGEEFPAEASISKVAVGGETLFSVVLRDTTYRKSVEEALKRAVTARDEVLGIVAHDLRNPLSLIMMTANAMRRRSGDEPDRRNAETPSAILRAAERMNQLIGDLLDIALVEAGQLRVEFGLLPAADLARDAVEMQRPVAEASGVKISLEVEPDVRTAWGDRRRLLQVFENLIGNATKFTPPGGRIVVRVAVKDEDVVFSVTDTGVGIAPDALPHVFDRFWQATTRARRLGAGLGLPITKGIVEAHGGRIGVESEVERGTTFFFTIPASQRSAGDDGNGDAAASRDQLAHVVSKPAVAARSSERPQGLEPAVTGDVQ